MAIKFSSKRPLTDEEEAEIQQMIASDPDNPELTDEQIASLKPFREVFPDLAASIDSELARRGRPKLDQTKKPVTIRLDPDLVDHYRATGRGWQSRMNDDLRKAAGL
ncbi:BrnA antitoxin family protein [Rhizobium sp. CFBP 8762]|uniref:BrnA antitoxin family protein n=1 Tax=Rhizobium sp. CFBP 8762 TaxID=2775279 RepID=UPI0017851C64|nr:BrnA antitoxin family protein [Rhizobium sp. CFBP 8762]MBD8555539.1 BrnA antitoxin family protein [Rhizobium sp. CFBP 8762]